MTKNFKNGDRVKVVDYPADSPMREVIGKLGTVTDIHDLDKDYYIEVALDDINFQNRFSGGRDGLFEAKELEHV